MKLNIDCVRDVLLEFEDLSLGCYTPHSFTHSVNKHGIDNVEYTLAKLKEADYINADIKLCANGSLEFYGIYCITFPGHQFLENIRENKVWKKTQGVLSKVGSSSFDLVKQVATTILSQILSTYL